MGERLGNFDQMRNEGSWIWQMINHRKIHKRIPLLSYFQEILRGGGEEDNNYDLVQENYLQIVPAFENKKIIDYCWIYDKCFDFY